MESRKVRALCIDDQTYDKLGKLAAESALNRSAVVRRLIRRAKFPKPMQEEPVALPARPSSSNSKNEEGE